MHEKKKTGQSEAASRRLLLLTDGGEGPKACPLGAGHWISVAGAARPALVRDVVVQWLAAHVLANARGRMREGLFSILCTRDRSVCQRTVDENLIV